MPSNKYFFSRSAWDLTDLKFGGSIHDIILRSRYFFFFFFASRIRAWLLRYPTLPQSTQTCTSNWSYILILWSSRVVSILSIWEFRFRLSSWILFCIISMFSSSRMTLCRNLSVLPHPFTALENLISAAWIWLFWRLVKTHDSLHYSNVRTAIIFL